MEIPILQSLRSLAGTGDFNLIEDLGLYIGNIVGLLLVVASLAAFGYLVLGGISWITSGNDTAKVDEARSRITNAVIGLAIVASTWAIFLLLNHFFGLGMVGS